MYYAFLGLAFVGGSLLVFGVNLFLAGAMSSSRQHLRRRLEADLRQREIKQAERSLANKELHEEPDARETDEPPRLTLGERWTATVEESGVSIRPGQLAGLCAIFAFAVAGAVGLFSHRPLLGAVCLPIGAAGPIAYVLRVRKKRLQKLLSQLPEAFDLMSRTMRAGQTIAQALLAVADEFSLPIAYEFGYCYHQQNLGLSAEAALRDLARRTGLLEIKIFVLAVTVHRTTGGNLSELLDKLATVIRTRLRLQGIVRTLTAEGRMQAFILLLLAPIMLCIILAVNRPYAMVLFEYPWLLAAMVISMALGAIWMHRITHLDS
jgi:tight adherence protein B